MKKRDRHTEKTDKKARAFRLSRWGIAAALLAAVLLAQITGTADVTRKTGQWESAADLDGKTIGVAQGSALEAESAAMWPSAELYYASDASLLPALCEEGRIDGFLSPCREAEAILAEHPLLTAILDKSRNSMLPNGKNAGDADDALLVLIRASDYAYTATATTLADLRRPGAKIGGITGSELTTFPEMLFPDGEIVQYNSFPDVFLALENGKVDAAAAYYTQLRQVEDNYDDLAFITTPLATVSVGFGTGKNERGDRLKTEFNAYLAEILKSGEMERIADKWTSMTEDGDADLSSYVFSGENGTLRVVTTGAWFPMSYFAGDLLTGCFIELIDGFCVSRGYTPVFECADYSAEIAGINTGVYDLMADTLYITSERLERMNITDPIFAGDIYLVVKTQTDTVRASKASLFAQRLKNGFTSNFIREDRWKMLLGGLGTTLILALSAGLIGTILGAVICWLRMRKSAFASAFADLYIRVIQGVPIVVSLMILYYVVFNNEVMTALQISVIGFSLDFSAYAAEIFRSGIEAVPAGQARAAKALGFTPARGFVKVVLPQALEHILPVYSGQFISMVKLTSVAGYISVLELTKVSDLIRSRTFDAFFPLLTTALIYFLLAYLLIRLLKLAEKRFRFRLGGRMLRGVDTQAPLPAEGETVRPDDAAPGQPLLQIEHLSKSFGDVRPLKDVCCTVNKGDVICVIGPSGTGKSTFLNLINHLETPDGGSIKFRGEDTESANCDLCGLRRRIGMVFQSFNLFRHLTIAENVMLAQTELLGRGRQQAYGRAMALLAAVGLKGKADSCPDQLSGGQQQRAAIARAIAMDPEIVLFDEPTSALDPTMVGEVLAVIRDLARQGTTMLIVTHEMQFARDVSTRVFYMDEGVIYEEGTPDRIFEQPEKEKTRQFIRRLKLLRYRFDGEDADFPAVQTAIDEFAWKQMISRKLANAMLTVAEELCVQTILLTLPDHGVVELVFEYSGENEEIRFRAEYGGEGGNVLENDTIPVRILKNTARDLVCRASGGKNRIEGRLC